MVQVSTIIRLLLGAVISVVFVMAGSVKLFPEVNEVVHKELVADFATKYADIWNVAYFGITHEEFRLIVGATEVTMAIALWVLPRFSALVLFGIMSCALYSHFEAYDPEEKLVTPIALLVLLSMFYLLSGKKSSSKASKAKKQS
eukprot:gene6352-9278_t